MNHRVVAAVWIVGGTLPTLAATAFIVGCCVLPFHGLMHKLVPFCDMAASVMRGDHGAEGHDHEAVPPAPVREKQETAKSSLASVMPHAFRLSTSIPLQRLIAPTATTGFRSFISLGALRCDEDIGLHVLVETYLI